jgi:CubicO group peptidase (beta-lactamase class C family)
VFGQETKQEVIMKTMRRLRSILFLLVLGTVMMFSLPASSQKKNPGQGTTPAPPVSRTKIEIKEFGGEFEQWVKTLTITSPDKITFRYSTDQPGAVTAIWQVSDKPFSSNPMITQQEAPHVIASGTLGQVPAPGHIHLFEVNFAVFAPNTPPASPLGYWVFVVTKNAQQQNVGVASAPVKIIYRKSNQPQVNFGPSAVFPSVEIITYDEKVGVVPQTQLHFAVADVTLRVSNKGKVTTDPISLGIRDENVLMRQRSAANVSSLTPGASQVVNVHLDAILPPPTSQLPEDKQYSEWNKWYRDRCGVDLRAVMDWRGPQAQAPMNDHSETILVQEGWGDYAKVTTNAAICDSKQCFKPCQIAKNIRKEIDGHAVGYSFFVGQYPKFFADGEARTLANGPAIDFTSKTKITVASVSKIVTAIAAVRILDKNGVSIDAAIGPFLPSDWSPSNYVKNITFAQLLSHTSGIEDYGNVPPNNYETLKSFFTQPVSNSSTTTCQPASVEQPSKPINPNTMQANTRPCYSNYNFAIFRVLLPKVAKFAEDANPFTRPQTLANQYVKLVQQNVFDLVGQKGVACRPPSQIPGSLTYSFAYNYPGTKTGYDWGDVSLICGAAGWYLSVEDIAKVLLSISAKDGKILSATAAKDQFVTMQTRKLGWDVVNNTELEKNGGWGAGCDSNGNHCGSITTSVAIFGPVTGPRVVGVLFINSNISGGTSSGGGAQGVLEKAYKNALYPK